MSDFYSPYKNKDSEEFYSPHSSEARRPHPPFNTSEFDALVPPQQERYITDPSTAPEVHRRATAFFADIRASLFMTATKFDNFFLEQPLFTTQYPNTQFVHQHDTEIYQLRVGGHQTIATAQSDFIIPNPSHMEPLAQVYDERDNENWHVVSFLKFPIGKAFRHRLDSLARDGLLDANYPEAFVNRFNAVSVPKALRGIHQNDLSDQVTRDDFFSGVKAALMSPLAADATLCEYDVYLDRTVSRDEPVEHMRELGLEGGAPLAFAHTTVHPGGERDVTFGLYPLEGSTVIALREIDGLSKIIG